MDQAGAQAYRQVIRKEGVSRDQELQQRVETVGARIARVSGISNARWEFTVVDDQTPNAFATAGRQGGRAVKAVRAGARHEIAVGAPRRPPTRRSPADDRARTAGGARRITALRAPATAVAADGGPLQLSLFDERDLAEIESPDYPGERLVVCRNPALAEERARKRSELLAATERELERIQARIRRTRQALAGADASARRSVPCSAAARSRRTSASPSATTICVWPR